tara:strand:- start:548 stop:1429 length:882 start_codon:yes stop_codon:yes gene_type:complete
MTYEIINNDCLEALQLMDDESIDCCITSPPYLGLRDYGHSAQVGQEGSMTKYLERMVIIFREVKRVLKPQGTLWLNLGDSYNGSGGAGGDYNKGGMREGQPKYKGRNDPLLKRKDLMGIPHRVAFALQDDGWYLRQDIVWSKLNPMPEPVKDRCSKSHEYIFLLSKSPTYYFDYEAIKEAAITSPNTRNKRSVWTVNTKPFKGAHFAVFPPDLIEPCLLAGCPEDGTVLDPFGGSGTTAGVAEYHNRDSIIIELNSDYIELMDGRISSVKAWLNKRDTSINAVRFEMQKHEWL